MYTLSVFYISGYFMSEEKTVDKPKVEKHRLRGRNMFDVVNQLVTKYNSSNGWAVKNVNPSLLSFEVSLERSVAQSTEDDADVDVVPNEDVVSVAVVSDEVVSDEKEVTKKDSTEEKDILVEKKAETKPVTKTTKKASATSADKLTEAKKV